MNPGKDWLQVIRRVRRMNADEIKTRSRQEIGKRVDALAWRLGVDRCVLAPTGQKGQFFCDADDVARIVEIVRSRMPEQVERTVGAAERLLLGHFDLLGYRALKFGKEIDWAFDPVSEKRAPFLPWYRVPFLDFAQVGDHKVIWELNRHQFLVTLAKAYRFTDDARFADRVIDVWNDWQRQNHYPMGINWSSALEVAFRALSWMWAAFLLDGTEGGSPEFQREVEREVARSGWYIERFLSTYFAPNTHLLGEAAVLFIIGARYPGLRSAGRWRQTGWEIVLQECRRQIRADGLHFEQSIYYHVYALDFFLHARRIADRNGVNIPAELDDAIERMMAVLAELSQAGALPRFGDDDGGRVFDASRNGADEMLDPLAIGAVLLGDPVLRAAAPGLTEETLWLLGSGAAAAFDNLSWIVRAPHPVALRDAGIYAMTGPSAQLFIDAGEQGALTAGHGHADALSVQLASNGRLWLVDPGSFRYVGDRGERDRFRGTAAHNTLVVDGANQAEPRGPFQWGPLPEVDVERWETSDTADVFQGCHVAYERLASPVTHRRWVVGLRDGPWLIRDRVVGGGVHDLDVYFHFAPELVVTAGETAVAAQRGGEFLILTQASRDEWSVAVEQGDYSPVYGFREPAPVAHWSSRTACPVEFAVVLAFGREWLPTSLRASTDSDGSVTYEYVAGDQRWRVRFEISGAVGVSRQE